MCPGAACTTGPYWREHLAAALAWGFFAPVPQAPLKWTLQTASRMGDAWGFRYELGNAPAELITFKRDANRIAASGSGTVAITAPNGARFTATLPFDRPIPPKPRKRRRR